MTLGLVGNGRRGELVSAARRRWKVKLRGSISTVKGDSVPPSHSC